MRVPYSEHTRKTVCFCDYVCDNSSMILHLHTYELLDVSCAYMHCSLMNLDTMRSNFLLALECFAVGLLPEIRERGHNKRASRLYLTYK